MAVEQSGNPQEQQPSQAGLWLSEIEAAQRDAQPYTSRCNRIRKLYRYDNNRSVNKRKYQIFWANIETMKPAVYAKTPKVVVESRYKTQDPVARVASMMLERTIQFQLDINDYDRPFKQVRDDYLLYARGVPRVRYEPTFDEDEIADGLGDTAEPGHDIASEGDDPQQVLKFENIHCDYVQQDDIIFPKSRTWEELPWLAYRAFLTRAECKKRWKDYAAQLSYEDPDVASRDDGNKGDSSTAKATIYEIWDKVNERVIWIAKGCPEILEESEPYLKFSGFYPSPRPAYGTLTNDSLTPIPDFTYYQDQVEEVNELTARIGALTDAMKLVGFYPGGPQGEGAPEIEKAMQPGFENRMIAVKAWAIFTESGKGGAPIVWLPVEVVGKLVQGCIELRKQLIDDIYQLTGISDIMRGDTDANETKGAQTLKAQYSSTRIKDRRNELSRVARDVVRMVGEVVCEQFQITTMMEVAGMKLPSQQDVIMAQQQANMQAAQQQRMQYQQAAQQAQAQGQPVPPAPPVQPAPPVNLGPTQEDVMGLLRDGVLRRFELDIETDSTVAADEAQEKQDRTQFIQATSQFITAWGPIIQQTPEAAPLAGALLMFGVRAFPVARELETTIEEFLDAVAKKVANPQPPQPDPKTQAQIQIAQTKAQAEQQKAQTESQTAQFQARADMQKTAMEAQSAAQQHQMDMQGKVMDHQVAQAEGAMKMRTMNQQMEIAEQKFEAQQALQLLKPAKPGATQ